MYKNLVILCCVLCLHNLCTAQFVPGDVYFFGQNNDIQYVAGNLPVIISAPHGGTLNPPGIPDRTCGEDLVLGADLNTQLLALEIDTAFFNLYGCHPHIIISLLSRRKVDCNRPLDNGGSCDNNLESQQAWIDFHRLIDTAKKYVNLKYGKGFYMDVHGHGHIDQRIELGYQINGDDYTPSNNVDLNTSQYTDISTLRKLITTNITGLKHTDLLLGDSSLGTLLTNKGYPTTPSKQDPEPIAPTVNTPNPIYFIGGYNAKNYSSASDNGTIDGVHMELYKDGIRDNKANRRRFADSLAKTMQFYLKAHYGLEPAMQNCLIVLPIKLNYFKVFNKNGNVEIQWQTASEINNKYFEILRSADGANFSPIATVTAKGNSETPVNYATQDNNPIAGKNYYKLRQYDIDGNYKDFETKVIDINDVQQSVKVDPVSKNGEVKIYLPNTEKLPVQAEAFTATGNSVGKYLLNVSGLNIIKINTSSANIFIVKIYTHKGAAVSCRVLNQY